MSSSLDDRHQDERQRAGRGRPSLGVTKKVSLTLTVEEWLQIETSGKTVAVFLKEKMKEAPVVVRTHQQHE